MIGPNTNISVEGFNRNTWRWEWCGVWGHPLILRVSGLPGFSYDGNHFTYNGGTYRPTNEEERFKLAVLLAGRDGVGK